MTYVFFIEYMDGRRTETSFSSAKLAKKAYQLYEKKPEANAKGWGWEEDNPSLLSRHLSKKRVKI